MEQRAEAIARNRAEEGDIAAQPTDRPGGVERPAAQLGSDRAVGIDDQIDQRFPTDDDCVSPQDIVDNDSLTTLSASSHVK